MKYLTLLTAFIYSMNSDKIFGRDISISDWEYWVPIGMMLIGFIDGLFSKK